MDGLAMGLDDVFTNGQSQTGTTFIPAAGRIGSIEPLEDPHEVFLFDSNPVVADLDEHILFIYLIYTGNDAAIQFSVLGGVLDEIDEDHSDLFLIGKNRDG